VELAAGTIRIDGRDIVGIGLRALRRGLTIIPQDPVMFTARLAIQPPRNCSSRTPGV
jgi:ABC-type multidrug transport system fused ATPase/permease subunit